MDRDYPHNLKEKLLSEIELTQLAGSVHTWFPGTVPEYGTRWALM